MSPLNLVSWNVNGMRAVVRNGFMDWFNATQPDILCLQEVRATPDQLPAEISELAGYHAYWHPAAKKGYSGVGILSKTAPLAVYYGIGDELYDSEGRVLVAEYDKFTLINAYFPSGTRGMTRVDFKLAFNDVFLATCEAYRAQGKPVIFCGDVNIAHQPIDLTHAKANEKNSGFLPEERAWIDKIIALGYVDTFRHFYPDTAEKYTWWTVRGGARAKNIGWRIDYFFVTADLVPALQSADILTNVYGSDHCPISVQLAF